jgi:OHCU decarboxylase
VFAPQLTIDQINGFDQDEFIARLGGVFEGSPWIATEAWSSRPFASALDLHRRLVEIVERSPVERQLALIRAHPDLVGRAARSGSLSRESTAEQAAAGLDRDRLAPSDVETFARLNTAYTRRFGFPFVICARENKKQAILAGFQTRLENSLDQEISVALNEIAKISHYRLLDLVAEVAAMER